MTSLYLPQTSPSPRPHARGVERERPPPPRLKVQKRPKKKKKNKRKDFFFFIKKGVNKLVHHPPSVCTLLLPTELTLPKNCRGAKLEKVFLGLPPPRKINFKEYNGQQSSPKKKSHKIQKFVSQKKFAPLSVGPWKLFSFSFLIVLYLSQCSGVSLITSCWCAQGLRERGEIRKKRKAQQQSKNIRYKFLSILEKIIGFFLSRFPLFILVN